MGKESRILWEKEGSGKSKQNWKDRGKGAQWKCRSSLFSSSAAQMCNAQFAWAMHSKYSIKMEKKVGYCSWVNFPPTEGLGEESLGALFSIGGGTAVLPVHEREAGREDFLFVCSAWEMPAAVAGGGGVRSKGFVFWDSWICLRMGGTHLARAVGDAANAEENIPVMEIIMWSVWRWERWCERSRLSYGQCVSRWWWSIR